jgi:hypothetical protein
VPEEANKREGGTMSKVTEITYTVDPTSLADIPLGRYAERLEERLCGEWPDAAVFVKSAPTMRPCVAVCEADDDEFADAEERIERRARELAEDVFRDMCEGVLE